MNTATTKTQLPSQLEELEVMFVSGVMTPATGERFILLKDARGETAFNAWVADLRARAPALVAKMDTALRAGDFDEVRAAIKSTGNAAMLAHYDDGMAALERAGVWAEAEDEVNEAEKHLKVKGDAKHAAHAKDKGAGDAIKIDDDSVKMEGDAPDAHAPPKKITAPHAGISPKKGGGMAKGMMATLAKTFAEAAGLEVLPAGTTALLEKWQEATAAMQKSIINGAGKDSEPVNSAQPLLDEMISMAGDAPDTDAIVKNGKTPDIAQQPDILRGTPFNGSAARATVLTGTPFAGSVDTKTPVNGTPAQKNYGRGKTWKASARKRAAALAGAPFR